MPAFEVFRSNNQVRRAIQLLQEVSFRTIISWGSASSLLKREAVNLPQANILYDVIPANNKELWDYSDTNALARKTIICWFPCRFPHSISVTHFAAI